VNIVNPANHAVGVSLYLEPRYSGEEAEIETKIIVGQRHGDWKWALNLTHAVEWEDNLRAFEGEFGASFGIARRIGKQWSVGVEALSITKLPDYKMFESTAVYLGRWRAIARKMVGHADGAAAGVRTQLGRRERRCAQSRPGAQ